MCKSLPNIMKKVNLVQKIILIDSMVPNCDVMKLIECQFRLAQKKKKQLNL